MFHSEFSSPPSVTMRGDNQGKMVCSLYRKCAEVQWFDAEQQPCTVQWVRELLPCQKNSPKTFVLLQRRESNWEQRHLYAAERGDVSAALLTLLVEPVSSV